MKKKTNGKAAGTQVRLSPEYHRIVKRCSDAKGMKIYTWLEMAIRNQELVDKQKGLDRI